MNTATVLAYVGAMFGGALAFAVAWNERRSPINLTFAAGLAVLTLESIFTGVALAPGRSETTMVYWQHWRLLSTSFLPGIWLLFSLSYGRGNYREFLRRWKFALIFFLIAPPLLGLFGDLFQGQPVELVPG